MKTNTTSKTKAQIIKVVDECRNVFTKKLREYGPAWQILRPASLTDQIFIKAARIRSLQEKGSRMIDEGIRPEFIGIINYSAIGLIQLEHGFKDVPDMSFENAMRLYDMAVSDAVTLLEKKNHDYDEAWRSMRVSSITDIILMKIHRVRQLEEHAGKPIESEGIDANLHDMINYSIFALILLDNES